MADNVTNALINIKNNENAGKTECTIKPASKIISSILKIIQKEGYIGNFELIEDGKAGKYKIQLIGKINNCKAIKPRYAVKKDEYTKWEQRYLPSKNLGILIISTPKGLMTQHEAKKIETGGKLIAYIY